jgi:hypothetical protein
LNTSLDCKLIYYCPFKTCAFTIQFLQHPRAISKLRIYQPRGAGAGETPDLGQNMSIDVFRLAHQSCAGSTRNRRRPGCVAPSASMMPFRGLLRQESAMQQAKNLVHQNTRGESDRRLPRDVQVSTGSASAEAVSQSSTTPTGAAAAAAAAAAAFEAPASMQSSAPLDSICTDEQAEAQPGSTRFVAETRLPTRSGAYRVRAYRHTVRTSFLYKSPYLLNIALCTADCKVCRAWGY